MAFVASTSLNVALPAIQVELGARGADLIWIPNVYVLVQASLIILTGSLGDHYGRSRVCLLGIFLFGLASIICGFATATDTLIAGRFAQGIGSALIIPNSLAIVSAHFSGKEQGRAIGVWSGFSLLMTGLAPILGGILVDLGMWRLIFVIHIPLGILAALVLIFAVPESYNKDVPKRMSAVGALLIALGLGGITFGFIESSAYSFTSLVIIGPILGGILALAVFLNDERKNKHAILPLALFKSRTFSAANLITLILYSTLSPAILYLPLNMIQIQGYSATFTGLSILPMTILMTVLSTLIGGVVDRRGPRLPIVLGLLITALGFALLATVGTTNGESEYLSTFFAPIVLFGLGLGLSLAPLTAAVMASAPDANAGVASGVNNTVSRVAQVLAIGIVGGLAITWFGQQLMNDPAVQALPAEARSLIAADAGDLAETAIPDSLSEIERENVRQVIRESFAAMFSILMWIGAFFCFISASLAVFLIDSRPLKRKRADEAPPSPIPA